jgi:hypothetical protein
VDLTVYLPDEIGVEAKEAELNFSRLLRAAVTEELQRRRKVEQSLKDAKEFELALEKDGRAYKGRLTGARIASHESRDVDVYLTDDERVIVHDIKRGDYWEIEDPGEELRNWLDDESYFEAMGRLGQEPVVDL